MLICAVIHISQNNHVRVLYPNFDWPNLARQTPWRPSFGWNVVWIQLSGRGIRALVLLLSATCYPPTNRGPMWAKSSRLQQPPNVGNWCIICLFSFVCFTPPYSTAWYTCLYANMHAKTPSTGREGNFPFYIMDKPDIAVFFFRNKHKLAIIYSILNISWASTFFCWFIVSAQGYRNNGCWGKGKNKSHLLILDFFTGFPSSGVL